MTFDLKFYWRLLILRLPVMAALFLICSGIGVALAIKLPTLYSTSARLLVEGSAVSGDLAPTTVTIEATEQLEIIRQQLMTRANLVDIANELKVFENRAEMTANEVVEQMRSRTSMRSSGRPLIMSITFEASNPRVAAEVVNKYVSLILEANTEFRTGVAGDTLRFFEQDVERLNEELSIQSQKILTFKIENADALPTGESFNRSRRTNLLQRKTKLENDREQLVAQRERLVEIFQRTGRVTSPEESLSPKERQLAQLQSELESKLILFSPNNPSIRVLQAKIDSLEAAIASEKGAAGPNNEADIQAQLFEVAVTDIESRIRNIDVELGEIETELEDIAEALRLTPQNAIALDSLQRDYDSVQRDYNAAAVRLSQARMGDRIEDSQRGQRISLIEPAVVPTSPSSPNRPMIAAAGVGAGLGLALAFFVLLEIINQTVRRPVELEKSLGLTPIIAIPYMESRRSRFFRHALRVLMILAVIVGLPALVWAVDTYYKPVDLLVERLIDKLGL